MINSKTLSAEIEQKIGQNTTANEGLKEVNATDIIDYQVNKYAKLALSWEIDAKNNVVVNKVFIPAKGEMFKIFHKQIVLAKNFIWKKNEEVINTPEEEECCYETLDQAFQKYKKFIEQWPEWKVNKEYWQYIENNNESNM